MLLLEVVINLSNLVKEKKAQEEVPPKYWQK
jgi:hypothetical protein